MEKSIILKIILIGVLFLIMLATGVWTTKLGRPVNKFVLAIHKISTLLTLGVTILILIRASNKPLDKFELGFMITAGIFVILEIATGALLSTDKEINKIILTAHRISPFFILISTGLLVYFRFKM